MKELSVMFIGLISLLLASCYSFSGSSLSPEMKTVQINTFANMALLQNPNLSQQFTNSLQDRFLQRTKLSLTKGVADMVLEGEIIGYSLAPVTVVSSDTSAQSRLTISIRVRYQNNKNETKNFDKTFTDYADFVATKTLNDVQDQLTEEIDKRLIDQIFNTIVVDW